MKDSKIEKRVGQFIKKRDENYRHASFDYCYNYFHSKKDFASKENLPTSCIHLGFFLASWGMYRGSCPLLNYSAKQLEPVIRLISKWNQNPRAEIWKIDADKYNQSKTNEYLIDCYHEIKKAMTIEEENEPTVTLVTKIMLGVFGCVPAFDTSFKTNFGRIYGEKVWTKFDQRALSKLEDFYNDKAHKMIIDKLAMQYETLDFETGKPTGFGYTRAKIIDMIGFQKAKKKNKK